MYKLLASFALPLFLLAGLLGCGGGGGGGGGSGGGVGGVAPTSSQVQGVYQGTSSNGKILDALILEDGTWWEIYGIPVGSALGVQGLSTGTSTASNGNFTLAFNDYFQPGTTTISGSGNGTYTSTTLNGTFNESGVTGTFNAVVPITSTYNYNNVATLSSITGSWSGALLDGETATINVNSDGSFSGTSSLGCSATGTLTPRASGKNVFNATITFGAAPCALPGLTASGIALTYPLSGGTNQLIAGFVTADKSKATAFFSQR